MKKRVLASMLAGILVVSLAACKGSDTTPEKTAGTQAPAAGTAAETAADAKEEKEPTAEEIVLKLGTQAQASSDWIGYLDRINTRLGELSDGTMRYEVVLGGQLGTNAEHFAQMNAGTLDLFAQGCDCPSVAPGGQDFDILNLPFLFDNENEWHEFLKSDVFKEMNDKFSEKTNVKYIGHVCDTAPRALTTGKKPVYNVDDLKGMVVRVPASALQTQVWADFGTNPTQSTVAELMEGLQTGRYDGQDNGLGVINEGFFEYQKYYMELNHTFGGVSMYMAGSTWEKLTDEQRGWLIQAVDEEGSKIVDELWSVKLAGDMEKLKAMPNITVIAPDEIDRQSFINVINEKIPSYEGNFFSAGLYDKIRSVSH